MDWAGLVLAVVILALFASIVADARAAAGLDRAGRERMAEKARRLKETEQL